MLNVDEMSVKERVGKTVTEVSLANLQTCFFLTIEHLNSKKKRRGRKFKFSFQNCRLISFPHSLKKLPILKAYSTYISGLFWATVFLKIIASIPQSGCVAYRQKLMQSDCVKKKKLQHLLPLRQLNHESDKQITVPHDLQHVNISSSYKQIKHTHRAFHFVSGKRPRYVFRKGELDL